MKWVTFMNARRVVVKALKANDFDSVENAYQEDSAGVLRALQMHVYGLNHDIVRWRAIEFLGLLAEKHAKDEDEVYRNIIRRFILQMCEESANVPWASPEVISSIMRGAPKHQYVEFTGPLFYHSGLNEICYAGLFWAIGILATTHAKQMQEFMKPEVYKRLVERDEVETRAYGAWAFTRYPQKEAVPYLEELLKDEREAIVYYDEELHKTTVSALAEEALRVINR